MPAFTLYGTHGSTSTDIVRLTLAEGGFTDFDFVHIELRKGEQNSAENLKRHPWGKVPTVTFPGGFTLYECRAISRYLTRKYGFPLLPPASDMEATALFDQAQSEEVMYFDRAATTISFEKFINKFLGLPTDEAAVSAALQSLEVFFSVAEQQLQHRAYMAGNTFSLVDIFYIPMILRLFACGYEDMVLRHKAISTWWDRCITRPGIQKMLAADKEFFAAAASVPK